MVEEEKVKKLSGKAEREFLDKVMKQYKMAYEATAHNRDKARTVIKFINGDQWDPEEITRRTRRKRVCLTLNMLPDKIDKVAGDMRQNRARVSVKPADIRALPDIAQIREGMILDIEHESDAESIYDYVGGRVLECGEGCWRIATRYCEDNPFVQEIYMEIIKNSFNVYFDPEAKHYDKSDAKWAFIITKMTKDQFEQSYPDIKYPEDGDFKYEGNMGEELWYAEDTIVVAEYFEVKREKQVMCLMEDGEVMSEEDANKMIEEWEEQKQRQLRRIEGAAAPTMMPNPSESGAVLPPPAPEGAAPGAAIPPQVDMSLVGEGPKILDRKEANRIRVYRYIICADKILESAKRVPGKYIPIIMVTGKERNIDGKDYIRGLVHDAIGAQELVNYWNTAAAETVALAPKAPWMGTPKQFEGFEKDYASAHIENFPFLKYNYDPNASGPPQRTHVGEPPIAIFTQLQIAEKNLNTIIGTGPDLRDIAPDASGSSIIQRIKPAELGTFVFVDNLAKSQLYGYKVINEMIPEVYDTERDVKLRRVDETETYVPINMRAEDAAKLIEENPDRYKGMDASRIRSAILRDGKNSRFNDIGVGKYRVVINIGPSYSTQRQEALDKFTMLAQTNPKIWDVAGDLIARSLDVPGSDKLAARLKKMIPTDIAPLEPGETPPAPKPPNPEMVLAMAKVRTEEARQRKELVKAQTEMVRQKTDLVRLYKELKDDNRGMRDMIISILSELHSDSHPADKFLNMGKGEGEGIGEMGQMDDGELMGMMGEEGEEEE